MSVTCLAATLCTTSFKHGTKDRKDNNVQSINRREGKPSHIFSGLKTIIIYMSGNWYIINKLVLITVT